MDNQQEPQAQNSKEIFWKSWWIWAVVILIAVLAIFLVMMGNKKTASDSEALLQQDLTEEESLLESDLLTDDELDAEPIVTAPESSSQDATTTEPEPITPEPAEEGCLTDSDCEAGYSCIDSECLVICMPDCAGKECGDDGCGSSCGACHPTKSCIDFKCIIPVSDM